MPQPSASASPHPSGLVLASGSTYRASVLREAGWEVVVDPPHIDERAFDGLLGRLGPEGLAIELARRKLADVAHRHPGRVVLAADQVGVLEHEGRILMLTKQPEPEAAVRQLSRMAGSTHRLVNAVVMTVDAGTTVVEGTDVNEVTMRDFNVDEAREYVRRFRPFDTAGSYRLEDGAHMAPLDPFVTDIRGAHPSGVLGLPLPLLEQLAGRLGVEVT